jgi:hypothetical protein
MYKLHETNGATTEFKSLAVLMDHLKSVGYEMEPNAKLYGIDEVLSDVGEIMVYGDDSDSDFAEAKITN